LYVLYSKKLWRGKLVNLANHNNSPTFFHQFPIFCNMRRTQQCEVHFNLFCIKVEVRISILQYFKRSNPVHFQANIFMITTDHRLYSTCTLSSSNDTSNDTLLARGTRQILKNMEFVLLYSLMFGIDSFGFVLLLIDDWRSQSMQVNICQSFFTNPLQ